MPMLDIFQKETSKIENKPKPVIIVDHREKNSLVISELIHLGIQVNFEHLEVADFLVKEVAIERKTVSDFLNSMMNKRLIFQLENLKQYEKTLLIIEGIEEHEIYSESSGINPNAIRGFLLSILLKFQIPIIFTKDYEDTAKFIAVLAKKEEKPSDSLRAKRKVRNKKEQIQYILEGFPGIGPTLAKKLLKKFGTLRNILNTNQEELEHTLGKKSGVFKLLDEKY